MGQLNSKEIQTTGMTKCKNQSLSRMNWNQTPKDSEEEEEVAETNENAQTADQRNIKATA